MVGSRPSLGIRARLMLSFLGVLVPLIGLVLMLDVQRHDELEAAERQKNLDLARAAAASFDAYVRDVVREESSIAAAIALAPQPMTRDQLTALLQANLAQYQSLRAFSYLDATDTTVASTLPEAVGLYAGDREYMRRLRESSADWVVGNLMESRANRDLVFVVPHRVKDGAGNHVGTLLASLKADHISELIGALPDDLHLLVADSTSRIAYARPGDPGSWAERDRSGNALLARASAGEEVPLDDPDVPDNPFLRGTLGAIVRAPQTGWIFGVGRPAAVVLEPVDEDLRRNLAVLGGISAAALGLALLLSYALTRPIRALEGYTRVWGAGNLSRRAPVLSGDEVGRLTAACNDMVERLAVREEELRAANEELQAQQEELASQNEELQAQQRELAELTAAVQSERDTLRVIMENTRASLAYLDRDFVVMRVNSTYVKGSGHSEADLIGRNHFDLFPDAENQAIFEQVRATGLPYEARAKPFTYADQPERGVTYWDWTLTPIMAHDGSVEGLVLSLMDVTESARTRQRIEELAAEARRRTVELEAILSNMAEGVYVWDARSHLVAANDAAVRLAGFATRGELPRTVAEFHDRGNRHGEEGVSTAAASALRGDVVTGLEASSRDGTGRELHALVSAVPIRDQAGSVVSAVVVATDISHLKELDRQKDEFLSVAAHELRTPMTAMKGYAQLLIRRCERLPDSEALAKPLHAIERQVDRLNFLVGQLLDVSRIQMKRLELRPQEVDLVALASDAVAEARMTTDQHEVVLRSEVPELLGPWDGMRLTQVLSNLLSNAVKYSPRGGRIEVTVRRDNGEALVTVKDEGLGIPAAELERLFERYYRADGPARWAAEGMGLGLYVTRGIVEAHGGRVWVESEEGKGSTFGFGLPLARVLQTAG